MQDSLIASLELAEDRAYEKATAAIPGQGRVERVLHDRRRDAVEHVDARQRAMTAQRAQPMRRSGGGDGCR